VEAAGSLRDSLRRLRVLLEDANQNEVGECQQERVLGMAALGNFQNVSVQLNDFAAPGDGKSPRATQLERDADRNPGLPPKVDRWSRADREDQALSASVVRSDSICARLTALRRSTGRSPYKSSACNRWS
jgi:hypothetical protein